MFVSQAKLTMDFDYHINLKINSTLQNGKYEVLKVLGQGGFGITYLVRHTLLNKLFALKEFFPQDYCHRDETTSHITIVSQSNVEMVNRLRARFITEAQNIVKLRHPNIVGIHDVFEENDTAYYVMDYIDGESLDDLVNREGAMPENTAVEYATAIGGALDYIHRRHMTHLDVKPANIMLRRADGEPILIDFGLSKQYTEEGNARSTVLAGLSHGYSPLEQYAQDSSCIFTPKSDIYSLGATLYTMLTGRKPPEAPRLIGQSILLPENISTEVKQAVQWAMAPLKEDRCPSARDFINALNNRPSPGGHNTVMADNYATQFSDKNRMLLEEQPGDNAANYSDNPTQVIDNDDNREEDFPEYDDPSENKKRNSLYILFIILGIVVIGGIIGYYFYADHKDKLAEQKRLERMRLDSIEEAERLEAEREIAYRDSLLQDSLERRNFISPDLAFAELRGHVKSCRWSDDSRDQLHDFLEFDYSGNLLPFNGYKFYRDNSGQIAVVKFRERNDMDNYFIYDFNWLNGKLISYSYEGWETLTKGKYYYDSDGLLTKETSEDGESDCTTETTLKFYGYEFDEMGNWIKRHVDASYETRCGYDEMETYSNSSSYVESRTITYY